jgi:ankyrin repeat protein
VLSRFSPFYASSGAIIFLILYKCKNTPVFNLIQRIFKVPGRIDVVRLVKYLANRLFNTEGVDSAGVSEFHDALRYNNEQLAFELYNEGADVCRVAEHGANSVIYAAMGENNRLLKFVLEKGAKPNAVTRQGETALKIICRSGNLEGLKIISEYMTIEDEHDERKKGRLIDQAIFGKNPDLISFLIEKGIYIEHQSSDFFTTPLCFAIQSSRFEIARVLIKAGANVNAMDKKGVTPLLAARKNNNEELAKLLIDTGADESRLPGPCYVCNQEFFSGSYLMSYSEMGSVDWHCAWCGLPLCSSCAAGTYGRDVDDEHKICSSCMSENQLIHDKVRKGFRSVLRWAHRPENIGKTRKTFRCPECDKEYDLATAINTFPNCMFHDHYCPECAETSPGCPICMKKR